MDHLKFNRWATSEILRSVRALPAADREKDRQTSYKSLQGTLVHLYQADSVWFDRLRETSAGTLDRYKAADDFEAFSALWLGLLDSYVEWGQSLEENDWDRSVAYRNLRGDSFDNTIGEIVLHLVNHGSYHRGQVVTMLRQAGATPAATDLIHYYRSVR